jgi:hypothetical protein
MKLRSLALVFLPVLAFAQNPVPVATPAADGNFLQNGKFETFTSEDNYWDGVDNSGFLSGFPGSAEIIQEGGRVGRTAMAPSVQVADLNGDGLLDIMTSDALGYFRVYFNKGTRAEPKFDHCEFVPLFLRRIPVGGSNPWTALPKICLSDLSKSGALDLVIGTYLGQVVIVKNTGSRSVPEWRQPVKMEAATIPTSTEGRLWANLVSPAVFDWNQDGRPDLILGEGSYSANCVHLLLNEGTGSAPKFSEESRSYLAYGDGREQLTPAVVDYNGDGNPDLLVGDRTGQINIYLSTGKWKNGDELKRQENPVLFGTAKTVSAGANGARCVSPAVGDLNGDGLFDIVVGEPNGRIAISYNTGTPTEPKFGPLTELKGQDIWKADTVRKPAKWDTYFGEWDGNFYGTTSVVSPAEDPEAAPTESKHVLRFQYLPSQNQIIRKPSVPFPGISKVPEYSNLGGGFSPSPTLHSYPAYHSVDLMGWRVDSNIIIVRQRIEVGLLKPNTNYKLTFKVKGRGIKDAGVHFSFGGWLIKGGSGTRNLVFGSTFQKADFMVSPNWTTITKQLNLKFEKTKENDPSELNTPEKWVNSGGQTDYRGLLEIRATAAPDASVLYLDDIRLVPQ